jgi:hypothetical protein
MENASIYSAIYGEVNVSVSGGYVLQYAAGTRDSNCYIAVSLKSWSGRKHLDPTTYIACVVHHHFDLPIPRLSFGW